MSGKYHSIIYTGIVMTTNHSKTRREPMPKSNTAITNTRGEAGFTLIELSIVLVIIGLIVGGVLVGQDLIRAAEVRAQIAQIEKYNTAVNTFRGKFNAMPGDMSNATAASYGFAPSNCAGTAGLRDGNGLLDGNAGAGSFLQGGGETGMFWSDLTTAGLTQYVDGSFAADASCLATPSPAASALGNFMPTGKIGRGTYIYVYNTGGVNYYGVSAVSAMAAGALTSSGPMSSLQAYNIDKKMDDGVATTGNVIASYLTGGTVTASGNAATGSATATTCYYSDSKLYALTGAGANNGGNGACGLSFAFQ
jgi:prepilin-type N-terminal cleavage/methylation domain-containing protein